MGAQSYFLNGDATAGSGNCYTITPNSTWQNGTVWYAEQLNLNNPFTLEFTMNFGTIDANGADGMVFVMQTVGTDAIGLDGSGMGFQGFNPSLGIEFDTFNNTEVGDLAADHVAILKNGNVDHNSGNNLAGPMQANATSTNIEDGQDHIVKILWDPTWNSLSLYFDCVFRLSYTGNIVNTIFGGNSNVYWGFTGATGFYFNQQTICLQEYYYAEQQDSTICVGQSLVLAAPGNPQGEFEWTPAAALDDATSQAPIATPLETTEYCYTYTDLCDQTFSGCHTIFVEVPPVISAGDDDTICAGEIYLLAGTCDNPDAAIQWTTGDGNILFDEISLSPTINAGGQYTLNAQSPGAGCLATDLVVISETPLPVIEIETPIEKCPGEMISLDAGSNWDEVLWENGQSTYTLDVNEPGFYPFTVAENNCSETAIFEVVDVTLPLLNLGPDAIICEGQSASFDAGMDGVWSTGDVSSSITVSNAGLYIFEHTVSDCTIQDSVELTIQLPPIVELGETEVICEGETLLLEIDYAGFWSTGEIGNSIAVTATGDYEVEVVQGPCVVDDAKHVDVLPLPFVDLGVDPVYCAGSVVTIGESEDLSADYLWSTGEETPQIEIKEGGEYILTMTTFCGSSVDTLNIIFDDCDYSIYAPNSFSPDQDGLNDVYFVQTNNLLSASLNIFDRWGILIFSTTDLKQPWTGDVINGTHFAPDGVYEYQLKFITEKGAAGERHGHILLFR